MDIDPRLLWSMIISPVSVADIAAGFILVVTPAPGVAKPQLRQDMQWRRIGAPVIGGDAHQNVVEHRPWRIRQTHQSSDYRRTRRYRVVSNSVWSLPRRLFSSTSALVGKCLLRIFIEHFQIGMTGRSIQIVIEFLDIFAVIAFAVSQAEQAFFQNGIMSIPEGQSEAESLGACR